MMRLLMVILIVSGSSSMANALSAKFQQYMECAVFYDMAASTYMHREGITEKALEFQDASERLTQPVIGSLGFDEFGQHFNKIAERVSSNWQSYDDSFEIKEAEYRTNCRKVLATLK